MTATQIEPRVGDPRGSIFLRADAFDDMTRWHDRVGELRRETRALWVAEEGWTPFWAILHHDDVTEISRRSDVFFNTQRSFPSPDVTYEMLELLGIELPATLVHLHGEVHQKYRQVTSEWFKPAAVRGLETKINEIASEYADLLAEFGGTCDFATDIAMPFTTRVIMTIFGVPQSDERLMLELTQGLFGAGDPEFLGDFADSTSLAMDTLTKFRDYFDALTLDRRAHPTDDLATVIANGTVDGEPMGDAERLWYYIIVATAGHDTTSYAASGGLEVLLANPDQLLELAGDPTLINPAVEEILRWTSPVRSFLRWAQEDVVLKSGVEISAGEAVLTCYPSANRDEAVFVDPMRFDIHRPNADRLLSFGMGVHYCLGAQVARREVRSLLGQVLERFEHVELAGEPRWMASHLVSGVKHLPISYTLR